MFMRQSQNGAVAAQSRVLLWVLLFLPLMALLVVIGCSPKIERVRLLPVKLPPKPADYPIQLFSDKGPECPFEEVGLVTCRKRNIFVSMEEVTESLRAEARKMGGDAVIKVNLGSAIVGSGYSTEKGEGSSEISQQPFISGTVIRWKNPGCTK
jgi:hypothetical protein